MDFVTMNIMDMDIELVIISFSYYCDVILGNHQSIVDISLHTETLYVEDNVIEI